MIFWRVFWVCFCGLLFGSAAANAHEHKPNQDGQARYIANEAVMVTAGETKILFDPLPLTGFGTYPDVSAEDRAAIMKGTAPFDGVDAVFISHAHRDHFSADAMNEFMSVRTKADLIAPEQAIAMMRRAPGWDEKFEARITSVKLGFGDAPTLFKIANIETGAVRIPHSGWPQRADVENIVYRVKISGGVTVAHMGDADINLSHYAPYENYWQAEKTDLAFPPYWIYLVPGGNEILDLMQVKNSVGIHVPIKVPANLKSSGADFFSIRGETRKIGNKPSGGLQAACNPVLFDAASFTVCAFDARSDIRLFWGDDAKIPFGDFDVLAKYVSAAGQELIFAMNGGMYHADRKPVGYYLQKDLQLTGLQMKESVGNFGLLPNGVFYFGAETAGVMETQAFATKDMDIQYATQSGPMLVIDGELHPKFRRKSESKKRRNGVGVSLDGQTVYFAISEQPVNFHHFGRLFRDHLQTPNALYLDGVVSRLFDAQGQRNDPGMPMGPIIGVVR